MNYGGCDEPREPSPIASCGRPKRHPVQRRATAVSTLRTLRVTSCCAQMQEEEISYSGPNVRRTPATLPIGPCARASLGPQARSASVHAARRARYRGCVCHPGFDCGRSCARCTRRGWSLRRLHGCRRKAARRPARASRGPPVPSGPPRGLGAFRAPTPRRRANASTPELRSPGSRLITSQDAGAGMRRCVLTWSPAAHYRYCV